MSENLRDNLHRDTSVEHQRRRSVAGKMRGEALGDTAGFADLLEDEVIALVGAERQPEIITAQNLQRRVVQRDDVEDTRLDAALFEVKDTVLLTNVLGDEARHIGECQCRVGGKDKAVTGVDEALGGERLRANAFKFLLGQRIYLLLLHSDSDVAEGVAVNQVVVNGIREDGFCLTKVIA